MHWHGKSATYKALSHSEYNGDTNETSPSFLESNLGEKTDRYTKI